MFEVGMQFDYLSDLHIEFFRFVPQADFCRYWESVLATQSSNMVLIAGDIMTGMRTDADGHLRWVMDALTKRYDRVICVLGNHDYWSSTPYHGVLSGARECFPEITFLENETLDLSALQIFGATWWTNIPPTNADIITRCMPDFRFITGDDSPFTPAVATTLHTESRRILAGCLTKPTIVLTHHCPSFRSNTWPVSRITAGFCSHDDDFILEHPMIRAWVHGHVHDPIQYEIGDVPVCCNPHGYIGKERPLNDPLPIRTLTLDV